MTVINGSYKEREKWVGKFSLQHSTATSRARGGGRGSYKKKEVKHAKKTRIPKSSGKDKTLKEEEGGP